MKQNLVSGNIFKSLIIFATPVFLTLFLQATYGAADLIIVGKFANTYEQSAVASGSQLFNMITMIITGFTMAITVSVGNYIGGKKYNSASKTIGTALIIFAILAIIITCIIVPFSEYFASVIHAPKEAFKQSNNYIKICGIGIIFIMAYNVISAIFRGIGDSKTPLLIVIIACIINVLGDLVLVGGFNLGATGAAIATVSAQIISVIFSFYFIYQKKLPFSFSKKNLNLNFVYLKKLLAIGLPIALQEMLVQFSFLFIQIIVNMKGVVESAAVGVAEKVCVFLMLVASAYMQSICTFVAQNNGAKEFERSKKALNYGNNGILWRF